MKIRITTNREIKDKDFRVYILSLNQQGIPVDGKILLEKGIMSYTDNNGYAKVTTTYEILN